MCQCPQGDLDAKIFKSLSILSYRFENLLQLIIKFYRKAYDILNYIPLARSIKQDPIKVEDVTHLYKIRKSNDVRIGKEQEIQDTCERTKLVEDEILKEEKAILGYLNNRSLSLVSGKIILKEEKAILGYLNNLSLSLVFGKIIVNVSTYSGEDYLTISHVDKVTLEDRGVEITNSVVFCELRYFFLIYYLCLDISSLGCKYFFVCKSFITKLPKVILDNLF